ncbi:dienelactone hydrolase family protein [Maritimibacter sp. 55A14]|uniref:dienelactone hydrolase family protein n=1 Tax=Maritimibacter sp. 55A14 TaxID=2174844 RepID=UPI001E369048|nr:alpha/beta family hydrolase [Maritimibacter sp. 55A14]
MVLQQGSKQFVTLGARGQQGILRLPRDAGAMVLFAHGAGSSHLSPRNNSVADVFAAQGIATLLFDLLTPEEAEDRANIFDIPLLAGRVTEAIAWVRHDPRLASLPLGLFGASTGAAAALVAAAETPGQVAAVVSRGGRPDLAGRRLRFVRAPTLLIVGARDHGVIELNQDAAMQLHCKHRLELVEGASHLFTEPGTLQRAADLAVGWFTAHLKTAVPG